jgi:hypothetical protein
MIIEDGSGKGFVAKVDESLNLHTRAIQTHQVQHMSVNGKAFNIPWGSFTLTTATESALVYGLWSDTVNPMTIFRQVMCFGPSTGGSGLVRVRITRNPTGGTLISGGTAVTPINENFSSGNVMAGTFKKGTQGSTITGGSDIVDVGVPVNYVLSISDIWWVIPNGNSYAMAITPPSGNTSMAVYLMDKVGVIETSLVT